MVSSSIGAFAPQHHFRKSVIEEASRG